MELLQIMLENSWDLIYVMDAEGRVAYMSPSSERILGYKPEEMVGRFANDFLHPDDQPMADRAFEENIHAPNSTRRMEFRVRHRSGAWPVFEMYGRIVADEAGEPIAVVTAREVTDRKRLEQQRAQVLQFVGHDLRTPLTNILLHADLLGMALGERGQSGAEAESLQAIALSAGRMEKLTRDILDLARADAGGLWLTQEEIDGEMLLADALTLLRPLARERGIDLSVLSAAGVALRADGERLLQVISNLVANALRFTQPGGQVTLCATETQEGVLFSVQDTGCGIAEEDLPRVFERYWQAERRSAGTTGLGLAICKGIVEAHGGRIWVESAAGEGSTFRFLIPRPHAPT